MCNCMKQEVNLSLFFYFIKIKGQIEVKRRRGRRRKQLLDDLGGRRGYSQLKEEALDRIKWRNRFGGGCGPVVCLTDYWWWWWNSWESYMVRSLSLGYQRVHLCIKSSKKIKVCIFINYVTKKADISPFIQWYLYIYDISKCSDLNLFIKKNKTGNELLRILGCYAA
jgi:hypothetical protein